MTSIKSAAIIHDGKPWTGYRHHLIMRDIIEVCGPEAAPINGEQGFMTDEGLFVDRETAARIAFESGQMPTHVKRLFSEDIWKNDWCSNCGAVLESFNGKSQRSCGVCS